MRTRSLIFDIFGDYVRLCSGEIWVGSLIKLVAEFDRSEAAVRTALHRMVNQGWLETRRLGHRSYYSMTPRGRRRLNDAAQRIFKLDDQPWDGKWRLLGYDLSHLERQQRDAFRRELQFLGFGSLAPSTWICPNDVWSQVDDVLDHYQVRDHVWCLEANPLAVGGLPADQLVQSCWDLQAVQVQFREFIDHWEPRKQTFKQHDFSPARCFAEKIELVHEYRKFLFEDPGLPASLLPDGWLGSRAASLFRQYYQLLAPAAGQFFTRVFEPAPDRDSGLNGFQEGGGLNPFLLLENPKMRQQVQQTGAF